VGHGGIIMINMVVVMKRRWRRRWRNMRKRGRECLIGRLMAWYFFCCQIGVLPLLLLFPLALVCRFFHQLFPKPNSAPKRKTPDQ